MCTFATNFELLKEQEFNKKYEKSNDYIGVCHGPLRDRRCPGLCCAC